MRMRALATVPVISALTVAALAVPASAATTSSKVVALWHLDERAGATHMADASGRRHTGTLHHVTAGITGYLGRAYAFNGENSIVQVPSRADLNPGTAPLTVSTRLKVPATLPRGDFNVIQKGKSDAPGGAYKLEVVGTQTHRFGYPACAFNSRGHRDRVYGPRSIADGRWHGVSCHLTATSAYVTVDGRAGARAARSVGRIANSSAVTIGAKPDYSHFYLGSVDEVSISIG